MERDYDPAQDATTPRPGKRSAIAAAALVVALGIGAGIVIHSTASPAGKPAKTYYGLPNPTDLPAGGITEQMAMRSACALSPLCGAEHVSASAWYDSERGTWIWFVHGSSPAAGPTSGMDCVAVLDFFSGEILDSQCHFL